MRVGEFLRKFPARLWSKKMRPPLDCVWGEPDPKEIIVPPGRGRIVPSWPQLESQAHDDLSPAQVERLVMLVERCGEASVMAGKVLRYGYGGTSPRTGLPNQVILERKIGSLLAMIDLMARTDDVRLREVRTTRDWASEHMGKWMHHHNAGEVA